MPARLFGQKKVGHAGTLDPDATGVLLVGLGQVTRLLRFLTDWPKSYAGEIVLGVATSTLDASGEVTGRWDMGAVTLAEAEQATATLTGPIAQIPPMVSAVKIGGRRLHQLARQGLVVDRPARTVTVTRFALALLAGSATPVRSAVGRSSAPRSTAPRGPTSAAWPPISAALLGGGAHLRNLRRTAVGPFTRRPKRWPSTRSASTTSSRPAAALPGCAGCASARTPATAIGFGKVLDRAELGGRGRRPLGRHRARRRAARRLRGPRRRQRQAGGGAPGPAVRRPVASETMQTLHDPGACPPSPTGCVVTIGAYDGVHLGHRYLIRQVRAMAAELGCASAVVTFDRHPAVVVRPESAPKLLTDLDQKLDLLASTGIDYTLVVHFDKARSEESPEEFVTEVLVGSMGAQAVVVGHDFHFGHRRRGNVALLQRMGAQYGFDVHGLRLIPDEQGGEAGVVDPHPRSAWPRATWPAPPPCSAGATRCVAWSSAGDARGRTLGFPTANVAVPDEICLPADGIYAGWYERPDGTVHPAAISLGRRPDVLRGGRRLPARGPPARLRRRPLRGAGPGPLRRPAAGRGSASPRSTTWSSRWAATCAAARAVARAERRRSPG